MLKSLMTGTPRAQRPMTSGSPMNKDEAEAMKKLSGVMLLSMFSILIHIISILRLMPF